jgi:hypothetical protein
VPADWKIWISRHARKRWRERLGRPCDSWDAVRAAVRQAHLIGPALHTRVLRMQQAHTGGTKFRQRLMRHMLHEPVTGALFACCWSRKGQLVVRTVLTVAMVEEFERRGAACER